MIRQKLGKTGHEPNPDLPDGFQMTELGPLPEEWRVVRLGEVVEIHDKLRIPLSDKQRQSRKGIYPYCGANGVLDYIDDYLFEGEFVLLAEDGGYWGKFESSAYIMKGRFWVNNHAHVLRAIEKYAINGFLLYMLNFMDISVFISGTTRGKLTQGVLKNLPIPLPPLPEQRAIAHVLRTVQRAKEATEGVIAALRELKKSLMQHLFTYGPVPVTERERVPLQETEIGPLPAHWRVVRLGELGKVVRGASPRPKGDPRYFGGTIPRLMVEDVTRDYKYVIPRIDFLTVEGAKLSRFLPKGTVVIQVSGNPGTPAILGVDACIHDGFAAIQELDINKIAPEFLFYWLDQTKQRHKRLAFGAVFQNLQTYAIRDFVIPLPPLDEQREIARMLQAVDAKIAAEQARRAALEELFKSLLHELMSGQIRLSGDLTVHAEKENL
jgi:type I restriction enzyme S subunit